METDTHLQPTAIVIFGAGGDLTWRKLVPALFNLSLDKQLPEPFALIGLDRQELSDDKLRQHLREGVDQFSRRGPPRDTEWDPFAARISYIQADLNDLTAYAQLDERLAKVDKDWHKKANHLFYFATPPALFETIATCLGKAGLARERRRARIIVEKPLGYDLESALGINRTLTASFHESQIFRIDHYLGKETVQNILAFRFANPLYEPIWNRHYIDHVAVTLAEEVGVEHRGGYYEHAGALRDMVQNHLLQLLCLVAMEPPVSFAADEVRNKKVDVLHAIRPIPHEAVHEYAARGQYGSGWVKGERVPAYRDEPGVAPDSNTETFAALKLFVDNWRWQEVPFYLRTGKRLPRHVSEISIRFRAVPHQAFPNEAALDWQPARLAICIQPDEGIVLKFQAKQPGPKMHMRQVDMRFSYREAFQTESPDAYETLLWDVMANDATLFMRADQIDAAWSALMPVLEVWSARPLDDFPNYPAGTWGPEAAEALIARDGRSWLLPALLNDPPSVAGK
jgi:glucose-6-phosphate 1-dehydrogenase